MNDQHRKAPAGGVRFNGRNYSEGQRLPNKYFAAVDRDRQRKQDPAAMSDAAPNLSRFVIPHTITFQGLTSSLAKCYRASDEALRHSVANAHMMLNDLQIAGPLFARMNMTALLDWHIESEDDKQPQLKAAAEELTRIVKRTPRFTEYRRNLTEAIWYGRSAVQHRYAKWYGRDGKTRFYVKGWKPISGDKLLFRYDDGSAQYDPDQVGVKVMAGTMRRDRIAGDYDLEPTSEGMGYFLQPWERSLLAVHKHMVRDGEYELPETAGSVHGVGLRSFLYWAWYQKSETMAQLMEIVERTGNGFTIYFYPDGDPAAKRLIDDVAAAQQHTNVIKMPVMHDMPDAYRVEQIPPNTAGLDALRSFIEDYFGGLITKFILGQTLSTEASGTGLGSGVADLHKDSLYQIVRYDAINLEETITTDLLIPLRNFNIPKYRSVDFFFKLSTESSSPEKELEAIERAWNMGAPIVLDHLMKKVGLPMPQGTEPVLKNPQIDAANQQMQMQQQQAMMPPEPAAPQPKEEPAAEPAPGGDDGAPPQQDDKDNNRIAKLFGPILNARRGQPLRYKRNDKLRMAIADAIDATHTDPSDAQVKAGNAPKGKFWWNGWEITIETPKGCERKGKTWARTLEHHYGYIRRTKSERDGDHLDVYVGPDPESEIVFVVDQISAGGKFDEHKVMLGFLTKADAVEAYRSNYPSGWKVGNVTPMTVGQFRAWLLTGDTNKPVHKQVARYAKAWNESDHPRGQPANGGQFVAGSGKPADDNPASIPDDTVRALTKSDKPPALKVSVKAPKLSHDSAKAANREIAFPVKFSVGGQEFTFTPKATAELMFGEDDASSLTVAVPDAPTVEFDDDTATLTITNGEDEMMIPVELPSGAEPEYDDATIADQGEGESDEEYDARWEREKDELWAKYVAEHDAWEETAGKAVEYFSDLASRLESELADAYDWGGELSHEIPLEHFLKAAWSRPAVKTVSATFGDKTFSEDIYAIKIDGETYYTVKGDDQWFYSDKVAAAESAKERIMEKLTDHKGTGKGWGSAESYAKGKPAAGSFTWNEEDHPRESDGTFVEKGAAGSVADEEFTLEKPKPKSDAFGSAGGGGKKPKQTGFLLGKDDNPDQGLLFGDEGKELVTESEPKLDAKLDGERETKTPTVAKDTRATHKALDSLLPFKARIDDRKLGQITLYTESHNSLHEHAQAITDALGGTGYAAPGLKNWLTVKFDETERPKKDNKPATKTKKENSETAIDSSEGSPILSDTGDATPAEPKLENKPMSKQHHEMTLSEFQEAGGEGYIQGHTNAIRKAIRDGHEVPEEIVSLYAGTVGEHYMHKLKTQYGADFQDRLKEMAKRVSEIAGVLRDDKETGVTTIRQRQLSGGAFSELEKGDVVVIDGQPKVVQRSKKPHRKSADGGHYGNFQDVVFRDPKKTEAAGVKQALAAEEANHTFRRQSDNYDYPDLKREAMEKYSKQVAEAMGADK